MPSTLRCDLATRAESRPVAIAPDTPRVSCGGRSASAGGVAEKRPVVATGPAAVGDRGLALRAVFYPIFATIVMTILSLGVRSDPGMAMRRVSLTIMLFVPAWMTCQFRSILLDHRTAAMGGSILLCLFVYKHIPLRRWLWTDTFLLLLYFGTLCTQFAIDELRPLTPVELFRVWVLPYVLGRIFFLRWDDDIPRTLPWVAMLLVLTFGLDMFEALAKINVVNKVMGKTFALLEQGEGYRWGMKRSQGPMDHPIYNGMMLTLFTPWAITAAARRKMPDGKKWWIVLPALLAGCLFFTVSRGPQIAFLATCGIVFFFRYPKLRAITATCAIVGGLGVYFGKDALMGMLKSAAGETEDSVRLLVIDGEEVEYSGTNHRALLFKVYAQAIDETGWFGYGVGLKEVPIADGAGTRFGSIDNHYIKHLLEYGWWGLCCFIGIAVSAVYYTARLALNVESRNATYAAGLCGAIATTSVMMLSVWFSFDYGSFWLFSAGTASCLSTLKPKERRSRRGTRGPASPVSSADDSDLASATAPREVVVPTPRAGGRRQLRPRTLRQY